MLLCGTSPFEGCRFFFHGIFGSTAGFSEIFVKACPLILTSLGCTLAFQTGFFNIGAEGQFYIGAITATFVSLNSTAIPGIFRIILSLAAGFISGGLWAGAAAVLKAKLNISEIISTIMLNYIAINFTGYAVRSFLMDPSGHVPQSPKISPDAQIPVLIPCTRFHAGILTAFVCVLAVWFLIRKTTAGYELKAVGLNRRAAFCAGIPVVKNIMFSAILSGGLAATAGGIEVFAVQKKLLEDISSNCGYTAVLIALTAFNNPAGACVVSVLYAAMQIGAGSMQRQLGIPAAIVDILTGSAVLLILCRNIFHFVLQKLPSGSNRI